MAAHDPDWFAPDMRDYDKALAHKLGQERLDNGNNGLFYRRHAWKRLRLKVLAEFHCECQDCLRQEPRQYRRATVVHHRLHVSEYPGFSLSEYVQGKDGKMHRNLVAICPYCHAVRHDRVNLTPIAERRELLEAKAEARRQAAEDRKKKKESGQVTEERW